MKECDYSPQTTSNLMPKTLPNLVQIDYVRFTYPFVDPTLTFTCKTPELGNSHTFTSLRLLRETRGKTFHSVRYNMWPKINVLNINFMNIDKDTAENFKLLLKQSVGKYIGYYDYFSRQWKCLITNPDTTISQEAVGCGYAIQLQMEGELQ